MEQQVKRTKKNFFAEVFRKEWGKVIVSILLVCLSIWLLREDSRAFLSWWLVILVMGSAFMPVTGMLFSGFRDQGWLFSKVIAIAICGYGIWYHHDGAYGCLLHWGFWNLLLRLVLL